MNYTVAIFPEFEGIDVINSIRKKYDPSYAWLGPHIALVYYFKEKPLVGKIKELMREFSSFEIKLNKLRASSKNNYIFLEVTDGREKIIKIKDKLYNALGLKWDKDFSYSPHMTLANLKTKKEQKIALNEIQKLNLNYSCKIDSFYVLEVSEDFKTIKSRKKFELS